MSKKLQRLQGAEWYKVKDSMTLLSVTESLKGNLCGIYTDGKRNYVHWLNDAEALAYRNTIAKND